MRQSRDRHAQTGVFVTENLSLNGVNRRVLV